MKNPNCDNDKCTASNGEVRVLPSGGDSNLILCRACFAHELNFRYERNRDLSPDCRFALPAWDTLKVYAANWNPTTRNKMTLYDEIKAAGIPTDNHESDLYFPRTPESIAILDRHPEQKSIAQNFRNQRPPNVGELWVDVPFAFTPWWEAKMAAR